MKRFITCLMTVFFFMGGLSAQERVALGYCEDKLGGTVIAQDPMPHEFGAAIYLPEKILNKYVGSTINTIDFAIGDVAGDIMTVFITRELEGNPIISRKVSDFKKGWNSVQLKKGYTIKEGDNLYVGYRYYTTETCLDSEVMIFDYSQGTIPGTNWFSQDNRWWKFDSKSINFDLAIRAFAEGTGLPGTDVGISSLVSPSVIKKGQANDYSFVMRNYGTEVVKDVTLNILANGEVYDTKDIRNISVPNNKEIKLDIKGLAFPKEGNNTLDINVVAVNGSDDSDKSDNIVSSAIYSINENSKPVPRRILFEEYTTENSTGSVDADSVYNLATKGHDNITWIKHHIKGDKFYNGKETAYNFLFEDNKPFYPAISVDRNVFSGLKERGPLYFVGHENIVSDLFRTSTGITSYILPEVTAMYDHNTHDVSIDVDITPEVCEMPLQTDLRLTVYLVEDGIVSVTQKGRNEFVQNGVIRDIITNAWGDKIDISKGKIQRSFTYSVPNEWNYSNMRVVAFINNYDSANPANCMVYNTCETRLNDASGIEDIDVCNDDVLVWYENGHLNVTDGYSINNIYDVTGASVQNVSAGMYIVRLSAKDGRRVTRKIFIK